jgi:thioredoxin-related protein
MNKGSREEEGAAAFGRLKTITICFVLLGCAIWLLPACAAGTNQPGTGWLNYNQVADLKAEEKEHKPVLLFFRADWCYFCREMEDEVFTRPRVARALAEKVLPVSLDVKHQRYLCHKHAVKQLPTTLFLDSRGQVLLRAKGFMNEERLLAAVEYVTQGMYQETDFNSYFQRRQ